LLQTDDLLLRPLPAIIHDGRAPLREPAREAIDLRRQVLVRLQRSGQVPSRFQLLRLLESLIDIEKAVPRIGIPLRKGW
jgi:hypothetical protein